MKTTATPTFPVDNGELARRRREVSEITAIACRHPPDDGHAGASVERKEHG